MSSRVSGGGEVSPGKGPKEQEGRQRAWSGADEGQSSVSPSQQEDQEPGFVCSLGGRCKDLSFHSERNVGRLQGLE